MKLKRIGIVGLGNLGRGITASLLGHGFEVVGLDERTEAQGQLREYVEQACREMIEHAGFDESIAGAYASHFVAADSTAAFADCDLVVESVFEDLATKRRVYDWLEDVVRPDVPIASNTSALPITELQEGRGHPERFVGMHFAQPVYANRFLEIVPGQQTLPAVVEVARELGERLGKEPCVLQKDIPGFVFNRLAYAVYREALYLLEQGVVDAESIDRAFHNGCTVWATVCGPLRWIDISGGPELYARVMEGLLPTLCNDGEVPAIIRQLAEQQAQGSINGRGFYKYTDEEAAEWDELLHRCVWSAQQLRSDADHAQGDVR